MTEQFPLTLFSLIACVYTFLVCFAQENGFIWLIFSYFQMEKKKISIQLPLHTQTTSIHVPEI